jgi:hypothetical protein
MYKCNIDMQIRHSSEIGIADFRLSDVHGSDYPLFETVAGTVTTVDCQRQETGKPPGATRSLFFSSLPRGSGLFNRKIFQLLSFLNRGN